MKRVVGILNLTALAEEGGDIEWALTTRYTDGQTSKLQIRDAANLERALRGAIRAVTLRYQDKRGEEPCQS